MFVGLLLCALLVGITGVAASLRKPATRQLTPERRAAFQKQNGVSVKYANQTVAMIDKGQIGWLWNQASEVARKVVSRNEFDNTREAERDRQSVVPSRQRQAVATVRLHST